MSNVSENHWALLDHIQSSMDNHPDAFCAFCTVHYDEEKKSHIAEMATVNASPEYFVSLGVTAIYRALVDIKKMQMPNPDVVKTLNDALLTLQPIFDPGKACYVLKLPPSDKD